MLGAHVVQVLGQHRCNGGKFVLGTEGAQARDFFGQHHVIVRDVWDHKAAQCAFSTNADRAR